MYILIVIFVFRKICLHISKILKIKQKKYIRIIVRSFCNTDYLESLLINKTYITLEIFVCKIELQDEENDTIYKIASN